MATESNGNLPVGTTQRHSNLSTTGEIQIPTGATQRHSNVPPTTTGELQIPADKGDRTFYLSETQSDDGGLVGQKFSATSEVFYDVTTALKDDTDDPHANSHGGGSSNRKEKTGLRRQDSVVLRARPGEHFTPLASVTVDHPVNTDPRLGTLGELRYLLNAAKPPQVKKFLRTNNWSAGHRIRAELWKEIVFSRGNADLDAQKTVYRDTLEKLMKSDAALLSLPTFLSVSGLVQSERKLSLDRGRPILLRLLAVVEHLRPDFTYIPVLYPLAAVFLHYLSEEETFACVIQLLSESQKFLLQTDIAAAAARRTLVILAKKHVPKAMGIFRKTAEFDRLDEVNSLVAIFDDWKSWIFRDLPFSHLVRIVDCFLYEGQKIFFRVTLAILLLWSRSSVVKDLKRSVVDCKSVAADISQFCRSIPASPEKLLRTAFGIRNLKWSTIRSLQERSELDSAGSFRLKPTASANLLREKRQSFAGEFLLESDILTDSNRAQQLISWLPARFRLSRPIRIFNLADDGISMSTLWRKIEGFEPTVLVIKTDKDEVFGAFVSSDWAERRNGLKLSFFGTGETFLFKMSPGAAVKYSWVGADGISTKRHEEMFLAADNSTLIIGGGCGEGICIRDQLDVGVTQSCATFDNEPLAPSGRFQIAAAEVFRFATVEEE